MLDKFFRAVKKIKFPIYPTYYYDPPSYNKNYKECKCVFGANCYQECHQECYNINLKETLRNKYLIKNK